MLATQRRKLNLPTDVTFLTLTQFVEIIIDIGSDNEMKATLE